MPAQIKILSGPHSGFEMNIGRLPLWIGSGSECQLRLEETGAPGRLARLSCEQGTCWLEKVSEHARVELRGILLKKNERMALSDGDQFQVDIFFKLRFIMRQPTRPGAKLYELARRALKQGRPELARDLLKNTVRRDPSYAGAWLLLAELVENQNWKRDCYRWASRGCADVSTRLAAKNGLAQLEEPAETTNPTRASFKMYSLRMDSLSEKGADFQVPPVIPQTTAPTLASTREEQEDSKGAAKPFPAENAVMNLMGFLFRKSVRTAGILAGVTLIMFLLMHAIPGNPWSNYSSAQRMMVGLDMDKSVQDQLSRHFGLDLPVWRQYIRYLLGDFYAEGIFTCGAVCGNLGPSIQMRGRTVQDVLFLPPEDKGIWESRFGYSFRMVLLSALFAVGFGIPMGILSARDPKSTVSRIISVALAALISIPNFVLGLLAIIVLALWLDIISVVPDWDVPVSWITPAVVLAVMPMAGIARVTHSSLMNVLTRDYVRTAHAKGLTPTRVTLVHVLRNALVPIITYLGPALMEMSTSLFILENLYSFPGFGRQYFESILKLDYPMIMGLTLIYAAGLMAFNALIEILGEILDPRLRSKSQWGDAC